MTPSAPDTSHPARVSEEFVLAKCDFFVNVQLWPIYTDLDFRGWLSNFLPEEREHAIHLLNAFSFYSDRLVNQMLVAAFQAISTAVIVPGSDPTSSLMVWRDFLNSVIVTHVQGETPNITDSGYAFARKARQQLGIDEARILSPEAALTKIIRAKIPPPVVFVDDFIGSGDQFVRTWYRPLNVDGKRISFADVSVKGGGRFYYCTLVSTSRGYNRIRAECRDVNVMPTHVLPEQYSALAPDSIVWPEHLRESARDFLYNASMRAGIPEIGPERWTGYEDLGLALAFAHSVPDATLPLFHWPHHGWKPLVQRS